MNLRSGEIPVRRSLGEDGNSPRAFKTPATSCPLVTQKATSRGGGK